MPIAETTVVTTVKKSRKDSSKRSARKDKELVDHDEGTQALSSLFEIKESKYHEDIFARG